MPKQKIPTTRNWYKSFAEIMQDKIDNLERYTGYHWERLYIEGQQFPFMLRCENWNIYDAMFSTDWELYEQAQGIEFWLTFPIFNF